MANIFENILKVPGNILKGVGAVHESLSEGAKQRQYGPYYKENQAMVRDQAKAGLNRSESQVATNKARQAYYENLRNNPAFDIEGISKAMTTTEEMGYQYQAILDNEEATEEQKAEAQANLSKVKDIQSRLMDAYSQVFLGPEATGEPAGQPPSRVTGEDFDRIDITKLPMAAERMGRPGALGGMAGGGGGFVGPPMQPGFDNSKPSARVTGEDFDRIDITKLPAATPQMGGPGALGSITSPKAKPKLGAPKTTNELDFYAPKLDTESQTELEQIISSGNQNAINIALQRLRDKYGPVR